MKKNTVMLILTLVTACSSLSIHAVKPAEGTTAEQARALFAKLKQKATHYGRRAYDVTKRTMRQGVDLMVLGQNLAEEARDGIRKLEQKRDAIVAFGREAQERYYKLLETLETLQSEALQLYMKGMDTIQEHSSEGDASGMLF